MLQMNNGCICCTVQGDLLRVFFQLLERKHDFDYLVLETSGMADPATVVQTLLVDDRVRAELQLNGVVTVADSLHIERQLATQCEASEQIAFADTILLNKTDLVADDAIFSQPDLPWSHATRLAAGGSLQLQEW